MTPNAFIPKFTAVQDVVKEHERSPIRVTTERARAALSFIDLVPDNVTAPRVVIAIDGQIALVWEQGVKLLMVLPQVDGDLRFVAEFGSERRQGTHSFLLALPVVVSEILDAFRILH